MSLTDVNFFFPVKIQHQVELLRVAVEEEYRDGAGDETVTQILDLPKAAGWADQSQPRLRELSEVWQFRSELRPADVEDHRPWVLSVPALTDESSLHLQASGGNFQCFFKSVNVSLIGRIFILSKNEVIKELLLSILTP